MLLRLSISMLLPYYDIFISYSVRDRPFVEELAAGLMGRGLTVWYTKNELVPGEDIYEKVSYGLLNSRYGVAVISPAYHGKWTHGELFQLRKRKDRLIPVIHEQTVEAGLITFPELADTFFLRAEEGVASISEKIARKIEPRSRIGYKIAQAFAAIRNRSQTIWKVIAASCILLVLAFSIAQVIPVSVSSEIVTDAINKRILAHETAIRRTVQEKLMQSGARKSSYDELIAVMQIMQFPSAHYHTNKITFNNGYENIRSVAGLKNAGILDPLSDAEIPFGLSAYRIYIISEKTGNDSSVLEFILVNEKPGSYEIEEEESTNGIYGVKVKYSEPLRYAEVKLILDQTKPRLIKMNKILGFKGHETYLFVQENNEWICSSVR